MSAPEEFKHEMLVANAGSGKTYALTTRIIRLLLAGVSIDRIAALTFTRKSAGEFLDALLARLAGAALDDEKRAALAQATQRPQLAAQDCRLLLRHIIDHFGRLGLSTIDSFFARIARQFPLESGLPEEFAMADAASLASARERALARSFMLGTEGEAALEAMVEQCRQISLKNGERNVFGMLLDQIEALHQRFLETPADQCWGDPQAIWRNTAPPQLAPADLSALAADFEAAVRGANPELGPTALENLEQSLEAIRSLQPGQSWSAELRNFVERKLINRPKDGQLRFDRTKASGWAELTPDLELARRRLGAALVGDVIHKFLQRAQGLYQFVARYESVYADLVRAAGLISFADITQLLSDRADEGSSDQSLDWRSQVAYRIDQRFDHWLLDEFQDTSRVQWSILRCFAEEVLMDASAHRSFFYVGDTKQAIYGWRGGDADLFDELRQHYASIEPAPPLTHSWRSAPPIIDMVNLLFGSIDDWAEPLKLPPVTRERWARGWNEHDVAPPLAARVGYAAWRSVPKDTEAATPPQHTEVLQIIREVDPIGRGIECAVLVRQNQDAAALAAMLQSTGIPVAIEGKSNPCVDNPLGRAVLAALRAAAHPDDSLALGIARGMPSAAAWGLDDPEQFRAETLSSIAELGYGPTLQRWLAPPLLEGEPFLQDRAEALLGAAEAFDEAGRAAEGLDAFIASIEAMEVQEAQTVGAIRIMTVHQAKGLGFEMVIVSGLDKSARTHIADELVLGPDRSDPQWGMLLPRKNIAESDPVLRAQAQRLEAESRTNELCSAYVALTRAKTALYVLSDELPGRSQVAHFGRHLTLCLEAPWESGDPHWYSKTPGR